MRVMLSGSGVDAAAAGVDRCRNVAVSVVGAPRRVKVVCARDSKEFIMVSYLLLFIHHGKGLTVGLKKKVVCGLLAKKVV